VAQSGRAPAWQVQKPESHKKKKKRERAILIKK
jgi:hypothetical protein